MAFLAGVVLLALPGDAAEQFTRHDHDIKRYELEIRPDFGTGAIDITTILQVTNAAREPVLRFALSDQFAQVSTTVNGREAKPRRSNEMLEIDAPAGATDLRIEVRARAERFRSTDEKREAIDEHSLFLLWSDRFYPIDFADWALVKTSVLLPEGMLAIAPGVETSSRRAPEGVWHVFETSRPAVAFSVFADRRWVRTERRIGKLRMQTLLHPDAQKFADALFRTSGDVVSFYTDLHGYYPFDEFAFITISGMYARRAFPGFVGYTPEYLEKTMTRDGYDGHETALLWWGYATRGEGSGAYQWTEGFGDYAEVLYNEARRMPLAYNLQRAREAYLALPPGSDVPLAELRGNTPQPLIHGRLPWMMDAHRTCTGDRAFRQAIRTLFERYRYRTFTLGEFAAIMRECSGTSPFKLP